MIENEKAGASRICYIADATSVHTQRWLSFFVKKGYVVHLISYKPAQIKGVKMHVLPDLRNAYLNFLVGTILTKFIVKRIKPDLLHAHYVVKYGWSGAFTGFRPFLLTVWGSDVLTLPSNSKISRMLVKFTFRKADLVTCDGEHIEVLLQKLGCDRRKIRIIYFGVDTKKFKPSPKDEGLVERLNLSDSPVVISLRSLKPIYDITTLINSVPNVLREIPNTKFIICGSGPQEGMLKSLAKSLGVEDNVIFLGEIDNDLLPKYMALADVYVSTSLSDAGLSASTAEAMACGLPVVITDFGDNRKWVEDGVNGFIISARDHLNLAKRIVCLLKDKELRVMFGKRNRATIEIRNNYYKEMEKIEKIYKLFIMRS